MTNLNATLSHIQGNILITLDGPDGTVAEHLSVRAPLEAALKAGLIPGPIAGVAGSRDTILLFLARPDCGCDVPVSCIEGTAKALKAVLNTAGVEAVLDGTFERAARYDEHKVSFLETAAEEVRAESE